MNQQHPPSASSIVRFWERIPIAVRAIVVGLLVFAIVGLMAWNVILMLIPAPWSIAAMVIVLWAYLRYFSGRWGPKATSESRRVRFRATKLPTKVWKWSLIAALLSVVVFQSSLVVLFRIIEFPAEAFTSGIDFGDLPIWQIWLFILMAAAVAGITEEVGIRGYMQVPLEGRYGPAVGITISSIVFAVIHLNQAWAAGAGMLIIMFAAGIMAGVIAFVSGSLIPLMIGHTVVDVINFSYWWTDVAGAFDKRPIGETGVDIHFIVSLVILVASVVLFVLAARKTLAARQETEASRVRTMGNWASQQGVRLTTR
jgi:membrane protease YdiL (CAAX protease family)